jgi:hypothetical protein
MQDIRAFLTPKYKQRSFNYETEGLLSDIKVRDITIGENDELL